MIEQLMTPIAGPCRSGTKDAPVPSGHLPVLGEWFALPLLNQAGSKKTRIAERRR